MRSSSGHLGGSEESRAESKDGSQPAISSTSAGSTGLTSISAAVALTLLLLLPVFLCSAGETGPAR